ncbi:MAG: two-component regulator propeller domain-containing protein [Bacteroidota bacterium]
MRNTLSLRRITIFVIVQLFTTLLQAQDERHYNFIHYPAQSGIVSYQVNTAVQDDQGYMWFGTTNGLQRFDGIRFKTFRHDEKNRLSLPSNPVWQLLVDKKKNLWLLLSDGTVGIFDTHNYIFKEVATEFKGAVSPNTSLKRLITDEEGNLFYLISGSEVITFNEKAGRFSYTYNFFKQKDDWHITDFIQQPGSTKYWISVENGGMAIYNKSTGVLSYSGSNTEKESAIDAFDKTKTYYNLFFDQQSRLWTVSNSDHPMISCYSTNSKSFIVKDISLYPLVNTYFEIKRFTQQRDGTIWMHGLFLLARFSEEEKKIQVVHNGYENEHSISYEMVHCLYEDNENNVWVCTDNNGLYRFNPSREFFTNIDHTNRVTGKKGDGNILSFMHTKWGSLLVGTWNDGLYEYDKNFNTVPVSIKGFDYKAGPFIWNMSASIDSNTLWLGSEPGFYAVDQSQRNSKYFNPPILANNTIRQIVEDKKGNLWLGTQSKGLFKCNISRERGISVKSISEVTAIPAVQINKITIDAEGMVWVGTPENGLYVLDGSTGNLLTHFGEKEEKEKNLPERGISSVLQYSDSIMLISTATRLVKYNNRTKETHVIGDPGFISGFITAMEKDAKGNVWLTSTSGLYRIDILRYVFIHYDRTDGLDNEHFIQSASHELPDGKIFFGATHNFVFFDPEKMHGLPLNAAVKITDIKLENKLINVDSVLALKELELGYDDKPLVIEFSPFLFSGIKQVRYKMEGLDNTWSFTDKTYQAVYNYLPPGTYSFVIKPADDMGNNPDGIMLLKIKVRSPFWKTVWFYCLLALMALGLLFWLDRERMARKEAVEKMRSAIADDLHEEINTALENINILSEMARLKADYEPEKSKEFIEQINSKSHSMIIAMDDMLWSISPENDGMEKTVLRLKEYVDALKNRHGVQIDLLVDENVKSLPLNMKQRKDIFWFFKGGISNVVRTGGTDCRLHIMYEKPNLLYTLEFDTSNTDIQQLNNLRQRKELADKMAALHAKLEVKELKTKTIFVLTIPVNG